jgi:hypothetical protein
MTTKWIGPFHEDFKIGDCGFLIRIVNNRTGGSEHCQFRDTPARTNQSLEDRLYGWCGSYNDVATHAAGLWKVVKVAGNGRLKVEQLGGAELADGLENFGYPELNPQS